MSSTNSSIPTFGSPSAICRSTTSPSIAIQWINRELNITYTGGIDGLELERRLSSVQLSRLVDKVQAKASVVAYQRTTQNVKAFKSSNKSHKAAYLYRVLSQDSVVEELRREINSNVLSPSAASRTSTTTTTTTTTPSSSSSSSSNRKRRRRDDAGSESTVASAAAASATLPPHLRPAFAPGVSSTTLFRPYSSERPETLASGSSSTTAQTFPFSIPTATPGSIPPEFYARMMGGGVGFCSPGGPGFGGTTINPLPFGGSNPFETSGINPFAPHGCTTSHAYPAFTGSIINNNNSSGGSDAAAAFAAFHGSTSNGTSGGTAFGHASTSAAAAAPSAASASGFNGSTIPRGSAATGSNLNSDAAFGPAAAAFFAAHAAAAASASPEDRLVGQLKQMGFTDEEEIRSGIQQCQQSKIPATSEGVGKSNGSVDAASASGAAASATASGDSTLNVTVEEVMMFLVAQRENMYEAKREDEIRLASEGEKEKAAARRKLDLEQRCTDAASIQDFKAIFPDSWILKGIAEMTGSLAMTSLTDSVLKQQRQAFIQMLILESKSQKWYGRHVPAHYFRDVLERLKKDAGTTWLATECETLQEGLYLKQSGGTPKIFVDACPHGKGGDDDDDDDDDVIIIE